MILRVASAAGWGVSRTMYVLYGTYTLYVARRGMVLAARLAPVALALCGALLGVAPAQAQVVRSFTPRFSISTTGDITLLGNTLMSCSGNGQCARGQGGTGSSIDDNDFNMAYVDVDADATTFCSSTSDLALPAGATVLWAGLYWGGDSNNAARNQCKFGTPAAGYATQTATQTDVSTTTRYSCFKDVTTLVQAAGNGTYKVANVQSTPGNSDVYAGWSLVVVYKDPTQVNRNLVVEDGYALVDGPTVNFTVSGFLTPLAGPVQTRMGVVAYEGDLGLTGDSFSLNGTVLSDAANPSTNFFNSTVSKFGASVTTRNPNYGNQLGFDADLMNANGVLANGSTSAAVALSTNGDTYYPAVVTFATDLYAPVIEGTSFFKSVTDLNGGVPGPGDVLEYTVRMQNTGQDGASNVVFRDTLASNLTYVPGSASIVNGPNAGTKTDATGDDQVDWFAVNHILVARLGTGAGTVVGGALSPGVQTMVKFRATINAPAPTGTVVSNQAGCAFNDQQLGTAFVTRSDGDSVTAGFQATSVTVTAPTISGTVFEDVNYGGGAGRTKAASAGVARPNARVELYGASGAFLAATTTDATGAYAFAGWSPGTYTVRVVDATVLSSRPGAGATLLGVQTFRANATTGTAVADAARVGGEMPSLPDAGPNFTNLSLAALTTATATPQSLSPVTLATSDIGGVDFGFNYDTIVNVNDTGQGSLRQFLTNAVGLANTGLAQAGQTAGVEASIWMVADGLAHAGLRAGLANLLTAGVARVVVQAPLPVFSDPNTALDGTTQTANVGDTNAGQLGAGGTVGAAGRVLATVARPEVELVDGAGLAVGLDVTAASTTLRGFAIAGFGNVTSSVAHADIRLAGSATGALLDQLVVGASATAFADPGAAARSGGDHVRVTGASGGTLRNSLVGFGLGAGLVLTGGANGWSVSGCQFDNNGLGDATADGVTLASSGTCTLLGNRMRANAGMGVDARTSTGANVIQENTIAGNGVGTGAVPSETAGLALGGNGTTVDRNDLSLNYGAGVLVAATANANTITRSVIHDNGTVVSTGGAAASGQIGIDLLATADDAGRGTSPFRTRNDSGDGDTGGDGLLNFPVLDQAVVANGNFTLSGWARPGATIELFVSDGDPSGFGEGRTYVATFVEGSASDLDATTSSYAPNVNGIDQGSDNTNRFRFTVAVPAGVAPGVLLTATATTAAFGTSEFSGGVTTSAGVSVAGYAYADLDHDAARDVAEAGTGRAIWVKLVKEPLPATATQVTTADPTTGAYAFSAVAAGSYTVVLDDNATASDVTPAYPSGWIGTEASPGTRPGTVVNGTDLANQNFGMWNGSRVAGNVVRDDGAGGGTPNDGAAEGAEAGVAGARMRLVSSACAGGMCDSTVTDGTGAFVLWLPAAAAGTSTAVREVNPFAWVSTGGRAGTTGGAYARTSDDVTWTAAAGTMYTGLAFGDVPPPTLVAPGAQSTAPGGVALYAHRFTAGSAGLVSFGVGQSSSPALAGWGVSLMLDTNCNGAIDPGEPALPATIALTAGQTVCLVERVDAPAAAPPGVTDQSTLSASFTYPGASPALASSSVLTDVTTVLATGGLVLTKSVDKATARPGDTLTYSITYTNVSGSTLSAIAIQDATPPYTVYVAGGCGALGTGLTACGVTTQPAVGAVGTLKWTLTGALAPGASGTVTYQARVQ
jgi:uncharacterized repeat protein (TIGR01451 family)